MKFLFGQVLFLLGTRGGERNIRLLLRFLLVLAGMVSVYSVLFHFIMILEGREYSWITGFYWTLTVMSTLGFGDITFAGDLGKIFSVVVLLSGIVFLLVMLPFTFIQFFYAPWLEAQERARAPRELPEDTRGHVLLTSFDPITEQLVEKLTQRGLEYAIVVPDVQRALELSDARFKVVVGELGDPETYRRLRVHDAALVVANSDDMTNANISFTVRDLTASVPIVTNADLDDSMDILELAGSTHTFQFMKMLGQALARRTLAAITRANVIGKFDDLLIAEASAMRTSLEGKTLAESRLREATGINVVGIWERGTFQIPRPDSTVTSSTVLLLAGSASHLDNYDQIYGREQLSPAPVLILGGGRVGTAAAKTLEERQIPYRIIEKNPRLATQNDHFVHGSAADIHTLVRAGIQETPSVIITTHDDSTNIYLTIYCRRLRPDVQIISRATMDRNISKLHRAGADLVMSYASLGANIIMNLLRPNALVMLAEGLSVFRLDVPTTLVGKSLADSHLRSRTGCSVVAISTDGKLQIGVDPNQPLGKDDQLILIGTDEAEKQFAEEFVVSSY